MPVHPIETRYRTKEMHALFTEETKLQKWLDVEVALVKAHVALGNVPDASIAMEVEKKGTVDTVKLERVKEIEHEIHHDVMAMVKGFAEQCDGDAGKYIHLGATSYDIVDTAWALIFKDAIALLRARVKDLVFILLDKADQYKALTCVGRTHGQHAIPTTIGMKFANWADEMARHVDRIDQIAPRIVVGKFGGAVGTYASHGKQGLELERLVMEGLELGAGLISTQVLHRDRHAELVFFTALLGSTISKIAKEVRDLQRNELGEMFEPFSSKQVGSSTMASKRNPHKVERLCGLYRVLAGNVFPILENNAIIEHERDLTNSSVERVVFPETFLLLDFMLVQLMSIMKDIEVNEPNIERNLALTKGAIMSEHVMVELVKKGMGRQEAHEVLRQVAIRCRQEGITYKQGMLDDERLKAMLSETEVEAMVDPSSYTGLAVTLVERVVSEIRARMR